MGRISNGRVTLKDIADRTGFSINTVSRALRGFYVAEETRKEIFDATEELGYIGNSVASSMRSGSTRIITIILGDIANPHYSRMIKFFVNYLSKHGYTAIIYNTEGNLAYERNAIISSIRQGADGILISPDETDEGNVELLKNNNMPFVIFGRSDRDPSVTTVKLDDVKGGYLATTHLIKCGCKNIIFVNGPENIMSSRERLEGYKQALKRADMPYRPEHVIHAPYLFESVLKPPVMWNELFRKMSTESDFDGILAFSDQVALKVLQGLKKVKFNRINIYDIPIVGFDNIMESFPLPVSLSSISHAKDDMALVAPALLMEMLNKDDYTPRQLVLDVKLYKHV